MVGHPTNTHTHVHAHAYTSAHPNTDNPSPHPPSTSPPPPPTSYALYASACFVVRILLPPIPSSPGAMMTRTSTCATPAAANKKRHLFCFNMHNRSAFNVLPPTAIAKSRTLYYIFLQEKKETTKKCALFGLLLVNQLGSFCLP